MNKNVTVVLLLVLATGCSSQPQSPYGGSATNPAVGQAYAPPMDPRRKVSEQDCSRLIDTSGGNLMCLQVTEAERQAERRRLEEEERQRRLAAERRAKMEEEARQAKARMEAEQRAARERLERERAEQLAREEAARKARAAEEARLAAELKAREERERQEREAAEARARQRAEQEAREAAERERRRLEQEWLAGRALLESFVGKYGKVEKFKEVAEPISGFLDKTR
jgi:hypothetical protein